MDSGVLIDGSTAPKMVELDELQLEYDIATGNIKQPSAPLMQYTIEESYTDGPHHQVDGSIMDGTCSSPCDDDTSLALTMSGTPLVQTCIELGREIDVHPPVQYYYSHDDPGQYTIGHTPDNDNSTHFENDMIMLPYEDNINEILNIPNNKDAISPNINAPDAHFPYQYPSVTGHGTVSDSNVDNASKIMLGGSLEASATEVSETTAQAMSVVKIAVDEAKENLETIASEMSKTLEVTKEELRLLSEEATSNATVSKESATELKMLLEETKTDLNHTKADVTSLVNEAKNFSEETQLTASRAKAGLSKAVSIAEEAKQFSLELKDEVETAVSDIKISTSEQVQKSNVTAEKAHDIAHDTRLEVQILSQLTTYTAKQTKSSTQEIKEEVLEIKTMAEEAKFSAEQAKSAMEEVRAVSAAAEGRSQFMLSEARSKSELAKAEALDLVQKIGLISSDLDTATAALNNTSK